MTHEEAIKKSHEYLSMVGKAFINKENEKETIKAVVAWKEKEDDWQPHVCFYNWPETSQGVISHMNAEEFIKRYHPTDHIEQ
jgi:hypothetical protein